MLTLLHKTILQNAEKRRTKLHCSEGVCGGSLWFGLALLWSAHAAAQTLNQLFFFPFQVQGLQGSISNETPNGKIYRWIILEYIFPPVTTRNRDRCCVFGDATLHFNRCFKLVKSSSCCWCFPHLPSNSRWITAAPGQDGYGRTAAVRLYFGHTVVSLCISYQYVSIGGEEVGGG